MDAPPALAVPYDPAWAARFEVESDALRRVLAPWLRGGIHHVGSTAVPGLAAKPIIDMLAGVAGLEQARASVAALSEVGYAFREHRPDALCFFKPADAQDWRDETHHLHLTEPGSRLWRERRAFRDALRSDPRLVNEYTQWKLVHAATGDGTGPYTMGKRDFVKRVLDQIGIDLKPDEQRLSLATLEQRRRR